MLYNISVSENMKIPGAGEGWRRKPKAGNGGRKRSSEAGIGSLVPGVIDKGE